MPKTITITGGFRKGRRGRTLPAPYKLRASLLGPRLCTEHRKEYVPIQTDQHLTFIISSVF